MMQTSKLLLTLSQQFGFSAQDPKEVRTLKVKGMNFQIRTYTAPGFGHISLMEATGFLGLMKMGTLVIAPLEIDMPLFSYDRVFAMGNDTMIFELYDTLLDPREFPALAEAKRKCSFCPDHDLGSHWYDRIKLDVSLAKKGGKRDTLDFDACAVSYLLAYLKEAQYAPRCEPAQKRAKTSVYVEGLLKHGGPSTDVFKKSIGDEKTAELFRKTLFATQV